VALMMFLFPSIFVLIARNEWEQHTWSLSLLHCEEVEGTYVYTCIQLYPSLVSALDLRFEGNMHGPHVLLVLLLFCFVFIRVLCGLCAASRRRIISHADKNRFQRVSHAKSNSVQLRRSLCKM
jgi:hypothetical protein